MARSRKHASVLGLIEVESTHKKMVVDLRTYQDNLMKSLYKDKYIMICWCRRLGKDYLGLYASCKQCTDVPNSLVYYILPTKQQAKLIIKEGKTEEREDIIKSIVNEEELILDTKGNAVHHDYRIKFKNGSIIVLHGADSGSLVGTGVDLIVCSEAALFNLDDFLSYLIPNTIKIGGKVLLISTPRLGSKFNEMFLDEDSIYTKSLINAISPEAVDLEGNPVYTPEQLELVKKLMSEEKYNQEYLCDMLQHNELSIYGNSFKKAQYYDTKGLPFHIGSMEKVFVSFDLGMRDYTSMWFAVLRQDKKMKQKLVVFKHYSMSGVPTNHFIEVLDKFTEENKLNKNNMRLLMPHDGAKRMDTGTALVTRVAHYKKAGFEVTVQSAASVINAIEVCRASIQNHDVVFVDNESVRQGIQMMKQYEYMSDSSGQNLWVPEHGRKGFSDIADSFEEMTKAFYWAKYIKENKKNNKGSVFKC